MAQKPSFSRHLLGIYDRIFASTWPAWIGGLLLGITNVLIFTYRAPWFIYGGVRLWGLWLFKILGITLGGEIDAPWLNTGSLLDLGIIFGSFMSTLFLNAFRIRFPRRKIRLIQGFAGGLLMGVGTMLAPGCNIGGYFSAISALSLSGFVLFFGLLAGAYTGVRLVIWQTKLEVSKVGLLSQKVHQTSYSIRSEKVQPISGALALVIGVIIAIYLSAREQALGIYFLFGMTFGYLLQKSQFCLASSFRDLFLTGSGKIARGAILGIVIGVFGFSILQGTGMRSVFLLPVGWHTIIGGYIFGLGMVIAGGCASGMLFRAGEGVVQSMLAILGGMISSALFPVVSEAVGLSFGPNLWLVDLVGWPGAIITSICFLGTLFIVTEWVEMRQKGYVDD